MSITAGPHRLTTDNNTPVAEGGDLTAHDHIVMDNASGPDLLKYHTLSLNVSFHLRAGTPIVVRVYQDQARTVVNFGGSSTFMDLYLKSDQLDRLITLLTVARRHLP